MAIKVVTTAMDSFRSLCRLREIAVLNMARGLPHVLGMMGITWDADDVCCIVTQLCVCSVDTWLSTAPR